MFTGDLQAVNLPGAMLGAMHLVSITLKDKAVKKQNKTKQRFGWHSR